MWLAGWLWGFGWDGMVVGAGSWSLAGLEAERREVGSVQAQEGEVRRQEVH